MRFINYKWAIGSNILWLCWRLVCLVQIDRHTQYSTCLFALIFPADAKRLTFYISLFDIICNLDVRVVADHFGIGVYIFMAAMMFLRVLPPRLWQKNRTVCQENTRWKGSERQKSSKAEFHLSLNKQPCLSAVCIREAERAWRCCGFSCFSFLQHSGGSESGRDKRATTDSGEEEGGERAGLREFAGSLVYSLVVLTSEWTPADTELWRLAHVDVEPL